MTAPKGTKLAIVEAFIALSDRLAVDKITVRDISEESGLSIRTFYNYFIDKYDLIAYIYSYRFDQTFSELFLQGASFETFLRGCIGKHMELRLYDLNAGTNTHGRDSVRLFMHKYNTQTFESFLDERFGAEVNTEVRFMLLFYMRAAADAIFEWSQSGMPISPDELAHWLRDAMPPLLIPYLDPGSME